MCFYKNKKNYYTFNYIIHITGGKENVKNVGALCEMLYVVCSFSYITFCPIVTASVRVFYSTDPLKIE